MEVVKDTTCSFPLGARKYFSRTWTVSFTILASNQGAAWTGSLFLTERKALLSVGIGWLLETIQDVGIAQDTT